MVLKGGKHQLTPRVPAGVHGVWLASGFRQTESRCRGASCAVQLLLGYYFTLKRLLSLTQDRITHKKQSNKIFRLGFART